MNILVIGHSYIVDSNRQFWNQVAQNDNVNIDIVVPMHWTSNLIKDLTFSYNEKTDGNFKKIIPIQSYFKGNASKYFFSWMKLYNVMSGKKYDVIFVFQETWSLSAAQVSFLKILTKNKKTLYYLAVCQNIIKKRLSWVIPWERLVTSGVDRILYCTKEILDVLKWKKIEKNQSYFPFTYDQYIYDFIEKPIGKTIVLGYMGRLTEEKGINCLIESCKKLISESYKIKLILAGNGPLRDFYTESFVEYAGPFKHTEAHLFYHKINIFVLPSETRKFWKEQFGRVLVESLASGTPIVGSNSGAIPEVINTLELNYIFNEGDTGDLTRVLKDLIGDMEKVDFSEKMKKANELNFLNFSHLNVGKKLVSIINDDLKRTDG